jgi:hypothetical protein
MIRPRQRHSKRHRQRGFALLLVFLFAAVVAFSLYRQLPRAAFERARDKEQLLIDRGQEYRRAIEVYFAENKRFPPTMEDLEKAGNKRFLRHRYIDPMTGKDEWRIIHTNGSYLTDSLVQKPPAQNAANGQPGVQGTNVTPLGANSMNTASAPFGTGVPGGPQSGSSAAAISQASGSQDPSTQARAVNPAVLQRPSDRILAGALGTAQQNNPDNPADSEPAPFDPNSLAPITLATPNTPATPNGPVTPGATGQPNPLGAQAGNPQQLIPGAVNVPGNFANDPNNPNSTPGAFNPLGNAPAQPVDPVQTTSAQAAFAAAFGGQQPQIQNQSAQANTPGALPGFAPGIPGQASGQAGFNPQPAIVGNPNPANSNSNLVTVGPGGQLIPFGGQNQVQAINPGGRAGAGFGQPGLAGQNPFPAQQQFPGQTQQQGAATANAAVGLIGQQLRTPGPQQTTLNPIQPGANNLGSPGIAGVASKFEGPTIKSYHERTKYQEWEFVFDPQSARTSQQSGLPNQQQQNPGQPNAQPNAQPNLFQQSPFNSNPSATNPASPQPGAAQGLQNMFGPSNQGR